MTQQLLSSQVVIAGHSSGGHLATVVAVRSGADKLINLAGPTNLDTLAPAGGCPTGADALSPVCVLQVSWGFATGGDPQVSTELSPIHHLAGSPLEAAYVVAAEHDTLVPLAQLSEAADRLGGRAHLAVTAGRGHGDLGDSLNLDALAQFVDGLEGDCVA